MEAQAETNSCAAVSAQRGNCEQCASGVDLLGTALVAALEQALLAAHRLLGALDGTTGCQTNSPTERAQVRQILRLIAPGGMMRPPSSCGCSDVLAESESAAPLPLVGLTQRESEVLRLLAAGQSNRRIAQQLCLSPRTVQRHIANAYPKIGAHNRAEATAYALRHGLT